MNSMLFALLAASQGRPGRGSPVGSAPSFSQQSAPGGTVGVAYSYTFVASGAPTYSLGSGTLPAGVTGPDPTTGVISGTPTTAAGYTFTINATNGNGTTPSSSQSVTIAASAGTSAPLAPFISGPGTRTSSSVTIPFDAPSTTVEGGPLTGGDAITKYEVWWATTIANANSTSGTKLSPDPIASDTTATISGLSSATTYYAIVRAFTAYGPSMDSNIRAFTTS